MGMQTAATAESIKARYVAAIVEAWEQLSPTARDIFSVDIRRATDAMNSGGSYDATPLTKSVMVVVVNHVLNGTPLVVGGEFAEEAMRATAGAFFRGN